MILGARPRLQNRYRNGSLDDPAMCYRLDMSLSPTPISYMIPPVLGLSLMRVPTLQPMTQAVNTGGHSFYWCFSQFRIDLWMVDRDLILLWVGWRIEVYCKCLLKCEVWVRFVLSMYLTAWSLKVFPTNFKRLPLRLYRSVLSLHTSLNPTKIVRQIILLFFKTLYLITPGYILSGHQK